jgi:mRNA interferase MazF
MARYVPRKGDFVALTFDPRSGHEQRGRRPALVISNDQFNAKTGLAVVCPITNTDRGIPFHVPIPDTAVLTGFIMVDQVKSVDFESRHAKFVARAPSALLAEALSVLDAVIY